MKRLFFILTVFFAFTACNNSDSVTINDMQTDTSKAASKHTGTAIADTTILTNTTPSKLSVLVLIPYDEIANAGISPNIQEYLEAEISKDTSLILIKFPYKQLMNVPYQNVYDKKYCKPILEKIKTDIIVMSKLDQVNPTKWMPEHKWNLRIKIYNTNTGNQTNSSVTVDSLTDNAIKNILTDRQADLTTEIKNNR